MLFRFLFFRFCAIFSVMTHLFQNRRNFQLLATLLVIFGATLRVPGLGRALEYDEVWTLEHYVSAPLSVIFTDLAVPNNHLLHSLLAKLSISVFGAGVITLRLPAFLAGIAVLLLSIPVTLRLTRSRGVSLLVLAMLALNIPTLLYAQSARGYEIQFALLLAFAWGLLSLTDAHGRKSPWPAVFGSAAAAVAAVLTLPTSVLFLIPPLAFLVWKERRNRAAWTAALLPALFCAVWYPLNCAAFRAGQVFGETFAAPGDFFAFAASVLWGLAGWMLIPLLPGCFNRRRLALLPLLGSIILFPLLAALLTRGGGVRVYLPLVYPLSLLAAFGIALLCRRFRRRAGKAAVVLGAGLLLCLNAHQSHETMREPDLAEVFAQAKELPPNILPVYRGNEAVAAEWNNRPAITHDQIERIRYRGRNPRCLLQLGERNGLSGLTEEGQEVLLPLGEPAETIKLERCTGRLYPLTPLRKAPEAGSVVVAILPPQSESRLRINGSALRALWPRRIMLNQPILAPVADASGTKLIARIFAVPAGDLTPADWEKALALRSTEMQFYFCR